MHGDLCALYRQVSHRLARRRSIGSQSTPARTTGLFIVAKGKPLSDKSE